MYLDELSEVFDLTQSFREIASFKADQFDNKNENLLGNKNLKLSGTGE